VRNREMPFGPYYGSVDSTPLFLILLSETFNWTADEQLVQELLPNIYRALEWIERYGDLDGDGFVEYQRRTPRGLCSAPSCSGQWRSNSKVDPDAAVFGPSLACGGDSSRSFVPNEARLVRDHRGGEGHRPAWSPTHLRQACSKPFCQGWKTLTTSHTVAMASRPP